MTDLQEEPELIALPESLLAHPDPSVVPPPVETLAPLLPLSDLRWEDFERLCVALVQNLHTDANVRLYGVQGDTQDGIDLYSDTPDEQLVVQCRNVAEMGPAEIEKAVDAFIAGIWADEAGTFILATTQNLTSRRRLDAVRAEVKRLHERKQSFLPWDQEVIGDLLRDRPTIVRRFFGDAWTDRFCGPEQTVGSSSRAA